MLRMVVQNITCTANLNCPLDLVKLLNDPNTTKHDKRFSAVIHKLQNPPAKALIFKSGKFVLTGLKTLTKCYAGSKMIRDWIRSMGFNPKLRGFTVQNIVYAKKLHSSIDIIKLCKNNPDSCSWEPELFPGAHMKFPDTKVKGIIFHTGSYFLTGCKSFRDCRTYNILLSTMLKHYLK